MTQHFPSQNGSVKPLPNSNAAIDFLERLDPEGPWLLTAFSVDGERSQLAVTKRFEATDRHVLLKWLKARNGLVNIYVTYNPVRSALRKKPEKADIATARYLHIDMDLPNDVPDPDLWRQEQITKLSIGSEKAPPATAVWSSGNGLHALWRLATPVTIPPSDENAVEQVESCNRYLARTLGGDMSCWNVDRLLRLPGTLNIPDKRKRKRGRCDTAVELLDGPHDKRSYELTEFGVLAAPLSTKNPASDTSRYRVAIPDGELPLVSIDDLEVSDRCKIVIKLGNDPAKPIGPSRSEPLFFVACELVRAGTSDDVVCAVLTNPEFGISQSVLDKGKNSRKYAIRQIERAYEYTDDPVLSELNSQFSVVVIGNKTRVVYFEEDDLLGREMLKILTFEDFRNLYCNQPIKVGSTKNGGPVTKSKGKWWLDHPKRRQYKSVVFRPDWDEFKSDHENVLNLWGGFAVEALPGSGHENFLGHVLDNICDGNQEHYCYLLGWMAHAVQHPAEIGHVAVVIRGGQGTGKSFFVNAFGRLFGQHFQQVTNATHLVGNFNAHLEGCILLFADEAFYAGDKKHESTLKTIITEKSQMLERKGIDAEPRPSFIHLMMASNANWVVPKSEDDRRFFVLDAAQSRRRDGAYFGAIDRELKSGGYANLLYFLLHHDITVFDVRDFPETDAGRDQILESLGRSTAKAYLFQRLQDGQVVGQREPNGSMSVSAVELAKDANHSGYKTTPTVFGTLLGHKGLGFEKRRTAIGRRSILPPLVEARGVWDAKIFPANWEQEAEEVDWVDDFSTETPF